MVSLHNVLQAYQMRPSIIFFDEIDGLAPVRSSRQDQIHSSIVSTLLALMDGLDNRGEIIVIGATNRIDSIDPALRRPGRFDREFMFSLPSKNVCCKKILIEWEDSYQISVYVWFSDFILFLRQDDRFCLYIPRTGTLNYYLSLSIVWLISVSVWPSFT